MAAIPSLTECDPGILPVEYNVVVHPLPVEDKIGSILLPESKKGMDEMAQIRGLLVAVSPLAFTYDTWPEGARKPAPGDVVLYGKYAGVLVEGGSNKREFRILKDKDIAAIVL